MAPRLAEFLYWMATWIAVMVAILGAAAYVAGNGAQHWAGVISFLVAAGSIWLIGRCSLLILGRK